MDWKEISQIRKNGDYLRARELARTELQKTPNSLQLKSQIEWTYYSEIKEALDQQNRYVSLES